MSSNTHFCLICGKVPDSRQHGISFHKFPKNKEDTWLELFSITKESLRVKVESAELCSRHFTPDSFIVAKNGSKRLKKGCVPTICLIDKDDLRQKRGRLFKSPEKSTITNVQQNHSTHELNDTVSPKYSNNQRTCLLCRRQAGLELSFFRIPNDSRREAWLRACNISGYIPANARICSRHFTANDFSKSPNSFGRGFLEKTAIPSIFFNQESSNDVQVEPTVESTSYAINEEKSNHDAEYTTNVAQILPNDKYWQGEVSHAETSKNADKFPEIHHTFSNKTTKRPHTPTSNLNQSSFDFSPAQNDPTQQIEPEDNKKAIKCLVPNCPTSYPDKDYDIFEIPASRSWCFDWIDKLSYLPEWGGICEKHFHKTDVFKDSSGKKHLKVSAVPKFSLDSVKTSNDGSGILDVVEVIDSRIYEGIKVEVDVDEPSSIEPEISKKGEKETHKNRVIDLCRLCIKPSQNFRRINSKLKKMIQMCTSVKIDNDPVFPNHLCLQCFNSIAQCYEFRINSEEADRKLHEMIAEDQSSPPNDPASIEQVEEPEPVQSTVYVCNDNQIFESHNEHQEPEVRPLRVYPARKRKQNFRRELKLLDANLPSIASTFSLNAEDDRLNVSETPSNEPKKLKQNEGINKEKCQMYVVIPDGGIVPAITPTPEKPDVLAMYTLNKASAKKQKSVIKKIESRKLIKQQPDVLVIDDSE